MTLRTATFSDGIQLANNLTKEDREEVIAFDYPLFHLPYDSQQSDQSIVITDKDGLLAGIIGVNKQDESTGLIWFLCTDRIQNLSLGTIRQAREWTQSLPYTLLWNYADSRNRVHHKLLKFVGFRALRTVLIKGQTFASI